MHWRRSTIGSRNWAPGSRVIARRRAPRTRSLWGTELSLRFADTTVTGVRIVSITEEIAGGDETTVTADSPLGLALAGHRPGDTVIYTTPRGPQRVQLLSLTLPAGTPEGPADR